MGSRRNNQDYYYSDPLFQLELGLQDIRRALVYLLDEPSDDECFVCNRLRCACEYTPRSSFRSTPSDIDMGFPIQSSTDSISEIDYSEASDDTMSEYSELDYVDFLPSPLANSSFEVDFDDGMTPEADVATPEALPTPPPANTLPTPPWVCKSRSGTPDAALQAYYDDLLCWVQVSHPEITEGGPHMRFPIDKNINNEINLSWPPHPDSIWYERNREHRRLKSMVALYNAYSARYFNNQFHYHYF